MLSHDFLWVRCTMRWWSFNPIPKCWLLDWSEQHHESWRCLLLLSSNLPWIWSHCRPTWVLHLLCSTAHLAQASIIYFLTLFRFGVSLYQCWTYASFFNSSTKGINEFCQDESNLQCAHGSSGPLCGSCIVSPPASVCVDYPPIPHLLFHYILSPPLWCMLFLHLAVPCI